MKASSFLHHIELVLHTLSITNHEGRKAIGLPLEPALFTLVITPEQRDGHQVDGAAEGGSSVLGSQ